MIVNNRAKPTGILGVIESYMRRYHVSQSEMAERAGLHQPTISKYFNGRRTASSAVIDRMLAALEVEPKLVPLPLPMPDLDKLDEL